MEWKKDLLKPEKKLTERVIGIATLAFSIGLVVVASLDDRLNMWYAAFLALFGITHLMEGLGYSIYQLFGKAFILINDERISMKLTILDKEQTIYWMDITSIDYKLNKIQIQKTDHTTETLNLSKFGFMTKQEILEVIDYIAKEKQLR